MRRITLLSLLSLGAVSSIRAQTPESQTVSLLPKGSTLTRFVVVGDYGYNTPEEASVAALVNAIRPQFVITTGDNNYPIGDASTIDAHIGKYYSRWIGNYQGSFGSGASENRFFPSLGNHDWGVPGAAPYLAYFTLPGNERYYDFVRGPVHFYALDSDTHEPDGVTSTSVQAQWLQARLATATEPFQVVYFHHPPYSSAAHGNAPWMQWPFREWGADVVLSGHDHSYERVVQDGYPYFVCGLGGAPKYGFGTPIPGSAFRFNTSYGAMIVDAESDMMTLDFVSQFGFVQDRFALPKDTLTRPIAHFVESGSVWRFKDDGLDPAPSWKGIAFDDSTWSVGPAQLGYGDGDEATVVSYGPDPANKYVTTWFRRSFQVDDPTLVLDLTLDLLCDDGAVAYVNGVEVARQNIAAGPVTSATLAELSIGIPAESAFTSYAPPTSALVLGTNVVSVELHQYRPLSSDISFDAKLRGHIVGTRLIAAGSTWRYSDVGTPPAASWADAAFDDSSWASGPAQLGYGEGDEATVVSFGPNPNQKHITTWFRRAFTLGNAQNYRALLMRLVRDDGVVVYLNGSEVFRQNLLRSGVSAVSTTEYSVAGADESTFFESYLDARLLHTGVNVIAVELHQSAATSSDLSFNLELLGL